VSRNRRIALSSIGALVAVVGVALLLTGDGFGFDREKVEAQVRAWGRLGPLVLVASLIAQAVNAPLPSPPLLMAAGFAYGPWLGFAIGWVGLLLGAGACFLLARLLGRPFAERFIGRARLAAMDQYIGQQAGPAFLVVVSLRLFIPPAFDAVSYACGLVELPFHWFVLGTALGEVPKVASFTYLGAVAGSPPTWLTAWIMLLPAVGVLVLRVMHRRRRAAAARGPSVVKCAKV
jgi:uncharacterized membrane protein YdjX (TVP38/TMEM64 family)